MTSLLAARKAAFIFGYLRDGHCEITTTWVDGADFVSAFLSAFPDRTGSADDAALARAAKRLYAACKQLVEDGWLDRKVLSNHDLSDPRREPRWQYIYALPHHLKRDLKDRGVTPEALAERWSGVTTDRISGVAFAVSQSEAANTLGARAEIGQQEFEIWRASNYDRGV